MCVIFTEIENLHQSDNCDWDNRIGQCTSCDVKSKTLILNESSEYKELKIIVFTRIFLHVHLK